MSVLGTIEFKSDRSVRNYDNGKLLASRRRKESDALYGIGGGWCAHSWYSQVGYLHGRVEFLEKVIKQKLGDDFWNEYCKELD